MMRRARATTARVVSNFRVPLPPGIVVVFGARRCKCRGLWVMRAGRGSRADAQRQQWVGDGRKKRWGERKAGRVCYDDGGSVTGAGRVEAKKRRRRREGGQDNKNAPVAACRKRQHPLVLSSVASRVDVDVVLLPGCLELLLLAATYPCRSDVLSVGRCPPRWPWCGSPYQRSRCWRCCALMKRLRFFPRNTRLVTPAFVVVAPSNLPVLLAASFALSSIETVALSR